jgi:hypothetical protein
MRTRSTSEPDDPLHISDLLPITEIERQTGIRQATLRIWKIAVVFRKLFDSAPGHQEFSSKAKRYLRVALSFRLLEFSSRNKTLFVLNS